MPSSGLTPHPLRDFALKEMLARPFTPLPTPCRMLHFAYLPEGEARMNDRRALRGICRQRGLPEPPSGAKFHRVDFGVGKIQARQDRKAARTGAEIEHMFDRQGIAEQRAAIRVVVVAVEM